MAITKRSSFPRSTLGALVDQALNEDGAVIIKRPGHRDVAIIPAEKLSQLDTTNYLLASPRNRRRLLSAMRSVRAGKGRRMSIQELRKDVGLDE